MHLWIGFRLLTGGAIQLTFLDVEKACKAELFLKIFGTSYQNSYSLWIYPAKKQLNAGDIAVFFRANRQYLIQVNHIRKISNWFNYKLKVEMNGYLQEEILISRGKAAGFKKWLDM